MSKSRTPAPARQARPPKNSGSFQDRDLCGTSPEKGQEMFKPQGSAPVRMRAKMGGQP